MAKYSDILKNVNERAQVGDLYLSEGLKHDAERIFAPSDELAADSLIAKYPRDLEGFKSSGMKFTVPDISMAATIAGFTDTKGGKTKEEKFIEQFPANMKEIKAAVIEDDKMGERGWNFIYNAWKAASNAKMRQDIESERKRVVDGEGAQWLGSTLMKVFTPRRYEAIVRGDEPTWQDNIGDLVENSAYMVPAGLFSKVISGTNKAAKTGKYLLGIGSAPLIAETFDDISRNDETDPNVQRRNFSLGDVLIGAATNAGVGYGIRRALQSISEKLGNRGARGKAREFVENIGKSQYEEGKNTLARATEDAKLTRVNEGELSPETLNGGVGGVKSIGAEAGQHAENLVQFSKIIDNLNYMPKMQKGATAADVAGYLANNTEDKRLVERVLAGPYAKEAMNLLHGKKLPFREKIDDAALQGFGSYITNKYGSNSDADLLLGAAGGLVSSASNMLNADIDPKAVQKFARQEHKDFEHGDARKKISKALRGVKLTEEDNRFIDIIKKNPDVMKYGYTTDDDPEGKMFKMWLLTRGNDLLMQTGLVRPTWEAK